jgi:hypothetical protein
MSYISFGLIAVQLFAKGFSAPTSSSLPIVDLGYTINQATVNVCATKCMSSIRVLTVQEFSIPILQFQ